MGQQTDTTIWRLAECDLNAAHRLAADLSLSPIIGQILWTRGHRTRDDALRFLRPSLDHLYDPETLDGIAEAVSRISQAVARNERILVYGDYDVDGMTAAALLYHFFSLLSADVDYFLPRRSEEGYGLNAEVLRKCRGDGVSLVVTVDCGISARREAGLARELGLDLIITDHHEDERRLPDAVAVINPKKPGSRYPCRDLAGVGVAFKLVWALARHFSGRKKVSPEFRDFLLNAVGLVALGTVADVVPLTGENRALVNAGLDALCNTRLPGIRALMNVVGLTEGLSARDIAFRLAPRLNAAGRLNEPLAGFELLTTDSFGKAFELAKDLEAKNRRRQSIERRIYRSARKALISAGDPRERRVILLAEEGWHPGVLGIVASRLAEEFYRPTLLLSIEGDVARGSARSIPPFHLFRALSACEGHLVSYGGHAQAAGIAVTTGAIASLREALETEAAGLSPEDLTPTIPVDAEVSLSDITPGVVRQLSMLEPFGEKNPPPRLMTRNLQAAGRLRRLGSDGQHLSFFVRDGSIGVRAIAFSWGDFRSRLERHDGPVSLVFEPQLDTWRGTGEPELVVRDIRLE
ncbi:MAG: single-stranded-DNA-specific exonuclease RecJ [Planctomycetota bacterium]